MNPILCDYCDAAAVMFFPRRGPAERSFACAEHVGRAETAVGTVAHHGRVEPIRGDRPRFEELDLVAMLSRWREHRDAQRAPV